MKIILQKEKILNAIKAVKGIVSSRGVQQILSAILIETGEEDKIKLIATDLNLAISYTTEAKIEKSGKLAISAKLLEEIITKLPDGKDITIELLEEDSNTVKIQSEKTKYEIISMDSSEFPSVFNTKGSDEEENVSFEISTKDLNKAIKQTAFSAVQNDVGGVLSGICFTINENIMEMVATDGNRLTRSRIPINSKGINKTFICAYRTLVEISKLISLAQDKEIKFTIKGVKIIFEFKDILFQSSLIDGTYPKYQQLIPTTNEKTAILNRDKFISSIDRISVMVNTRTNIVKFNFEENSLEISTDTPEAGSAKERLDIDYTSEELLIAFNYKYVLECLRNMTDTNVKIEMSTKLSAAVIKPSANENEECDDYLCLIMPVQVR